MSKGNCNMSGACLNSILDCLQHGTTLYVYRYAAPDAEVDVEEIFYGPVDDRPNFINFRAIDMQYDFYNCIFSVEVK